MDPMADEQDVERNYPATPRRLEQARERGQVARSRELTTAGVALAAAGGIVLFGPALAKACADIVRRGLTMDRDAAFSDDRLLGTLSELASASLVALIPLLLVIIAATLLAPMLLSGWVFAPQALVPDFKRLDPLKGLKNLFSSHALAELVKAIVKCVLIGTIGTWTVFAAWDEMAALAAQPDAAGIAQVGGLIGGALFMLAGGLIAIALIDVPYQYWRFHRELRMSREELRQEMREMEGDPQLKARIRSLQRQAARRRMMAAVPKATVIVTNPTHYAVALDWREGQMRAPRVIAKGAGLIAQRIREIGAQHGVPLLEAPPLARALHAHAELDAEIPQPLYAAVAQVLAWVYQLRRSKDEGAPAPVAPDALDVPAELDPESGKEADA
jgi:flagellar biosynthesis protein FlhB